jgi:hypothetical protein
MTVCRILNPSLPEVMLFDGSFLYRLAIAELADERRITE